jgi:hypothetical protein
MSTSTNMDEAVALFTRWAMAKGKSVPTVDLHVVAARMEIFQESIDRPLTIADFESEFQNALSEGALTISQTAEEKAEARRQRLELQDRAEGGVLNMRKLSESEREKANENARKKAKEQYDATMKRVKEVSEHKPTEEPTAGDALRALNALLGTFTVASATPENQKAVRTWIRNTKTEFFKKISSDHPSLREKIERVLAKPVPEVDA